MGSLPLYLTGSPKPCIMNPFRIWSGEWWHDTPHHSINLVHPAGFTNKNHGVSRCPPKKTPRTKRWAPTKRAKNSLGSWGLGRKKGFHSLIPPTNSHGWQASDVCFSEMGNLRTSIWSFFPSNPSDIRPLCFFRKMFIYASQKLWLHCVRWTKKTPTTITKCIPNIPSWSTLNLSKSCILAFEPTGPIFVRQIFVRILRACRMKVGLVGWGWRVFFSVCPSKGGQIWCCQKDDEIFFQFQMSLAFLKGAEVYHFCWLPGFGLEQFFGKDRNRRNWDTVYFSYWKRWIWSLAMWVFLRSFFLVCSLFLQGKHYVGWHIMTEDLRSKPAHKTGDAAVLCAFGASVSRHQSGLGGFELQRTNWRDGRWCFRYDIYGRW